MANVAAIVNNNVVEGIIIIEPCAIQAVKDAFNYEHLIPVPEDTVAVGDTYDDKESIFLRDGVRIYPEKTDSERIAELETQIEDTQAALIELAGIVGGQ